MKLFVALLITLFLIGISVTTVFAVGGGGGGGGGSGGGSDGGGSGGGTTPTLSNVICSDDGSITFSADPLQDFNTTRLSDNLTFEVKGYWEGSRFTSEEAIFTKAGDYEITTDRHLTKTFTCPEFRFSCRIVELTALSCITDESGAVASFEMLNDDQVNSLKFTFNIQNNQFLVPLRYSQDAHSPELKDLQVIQEGPTRYRVEVPPPIDPVTFEVLHQTCTGKYYIYSQIPCTEDGEGEAITGSELKCGGYLNLEDRVACRLDLREDQENEYENFFPEECKSESVDADSCLEIYQNVQKCWAFPNGDSRIECVKNELSLGENLQDDKNECNQLAGQTKTDCLHEFNEKIYSLIKFRLYNLEEEGEELVEDGLLEEEFLVDFVVNIELKKQEFNDATTKDQRRQVILDVRELWNNLFTHVVREGE